MLVTFAPYARWTLLDHAQTEDELEHLFQREIDLISTRGIEHSRNYLRNKTVLGVGGGYLCRRMILRMETAYTRILDDSREFIDD